MWNSTTWSASGAGGRRMIATLDSAAHCRAAPRVGQVRLIAWRP
jgi:hypothetical protein